jgi:serine protease Do
VSVEEGRVSSILPGARAACILSVKGVENLAGAPVFREDGVPIGVVGFDLYSDEGGGPGELPGYSLLYTGASISSAKPELRTGVKADAEGRGWLGAVVGSVDEKLSRRLGLGGTKAVYVHLVIPDSPASVAGLRVFDIITAIDGEPLSGEAERLAPEFSNAIRRYPAGSKVSFIVVRGRTPVAVEVELIAEPPDAATVERTEISAIGLTVRPITWDFYVYRNMPEDLVGMIVDRIVSGTPAALAELEMDDVIVAVGGKKVPDPETFRKAVDEFLASDATAVLLEIRRGARKRFHKLEKFETGKGE